MKQAMQSRAQSDLSEGLVPSFSTYAVVAFL